MEHEILLMEGGTHVHNLVRSFDSYKQWMKLRMHSSLDISELGLRWPINEEYTNVKDKIEHGSNHFLLLIVDKKKWLVSKIKYGL